jgi:hypothetical protein
LRPVTSLSFAFLFVLVVCYPAAAQQARMKVVLDTDIGTDIDDGWALGP